MSGQPAGLWFEENRNRWRVRLYKNKKVFWLSYHDTEDEALSTLDRVKALRSRYRGLNTKGPVSEPSTHNLIQNLRKVENHQVDYSHYSIDESFKEVILFNPISCACCGSPTLGTDTLTMNMDDLDKLKEMDLKLAPPNLHSAIDQGGVPLCINCGANDDAD